MTSGLSLLTFRACHLVDVDAFGDFIVVHSLLPTYSSNGCSDVGESVEGLCCHADPCGDFSFNVAACLVQLTINLPLCVFYIKEKTHRKT